MVPCKALIMVVSRTDAIKTAVEALRPEVVGVISSQDILVEVVGKCGELETKATFRYRLVDSSMEIHDSFDRFEHLFSELEALGYAAEDVVLDVSGGTTPMRLGAALAAMTRSIRMVHQRVAQHYMAGDWVVDKDRRREVVAMDNPLESTGLLREGQAIELFNRRDYGAAALVFEDILRKVSGVERRHYYGGLLLLAEGYATWDVADYGIALEKLRSARGELSVGFSEETIAERAGFLSERIKANLSFLGRVRGKLSMENVVDMVENARRRITDQGRYDDSVARLYRAVEMWHQWRLLSNHSISADDVHWEKLDEGVGKTYLAGELIRQAVQDRRQRVLLVAPAALRDGPWEQFLREHDLKNVQCISFQELAADPRVGGNGNHVLWHDPSEYAMAVIDESHAYRNPDTARAGTLRQLLAGSPPKQVVLLTATPVNNSLWDLFHLLSYFIRNDAAFLQAGIPSLRKHFKEANAEDPDDLSPDKLFDVLDAVAVRRTRRFVKRFYPNERIKRGGTEITITFPQPEVLRETYELDDLLPGFFRRFAHALGANVEAEDSPLPSPEDFEYGEQLTLARYAPSAFRIGGDPDAFELQAAGLLRSGLLKRFESSAYAFARTCRKMARSHARFLEALDNGYVLTGDALAAWDRTDSDEFDPDAIAGGRRDHTSSYDEPRLRAAVQADLDLLLGFAEEAEEVTRENDPKLNELVAALAQIAAEAKIEAVNEHQERDKRKVIVFSYYADTVEWIRERLEKECETNPDLASYRDRLTTVTGSSGDTKDVLFGFAPISSQAPKGYGDKYDLLVATDVLAEGVNLQQARHIINFDLPWNPMRLVQRHGRIDRIGSPHSHLYLRCFFPSEDLDALLGLEAALQRKITQAAKSIGVEGAIIPGSEASDGELDQVFTHTKEQIAALLKEDATLFEQAEDTGALSGEEFRRELTEAMNAPHWKTAVGNLPWVAGSGKISTLGRCAPERAPLRYEELSVCWGSRATFVRGGFRGGGPRERTR